METVKRNELINNAIDSIMNVGVDIEEADAHYFIHSEKSVVNRLRELLIEEDDSDTDDGLDECYECGKTIPSSFGGLCGCQDA